MPATNAPRPSLLMGGFTFLELVYHTVVREVRRESGNAVLGLVTAIGRILALVAIFYVLFEFMGIRSAIIRGDVILFLVGGVLLFFMHNAAVQKTVSAGAFASQLMLHAPMTPTLAIFSAAIAVLYLHVLALLAIFAFMVLARDGLEIHDPVGIMLPFFLAWASGVVIGLGFLLLKPFAPKLMQILSLVYTRANLITSGKFFVANLLPASALPYFTWNPLFHCVDQIRGALFVNYFPRATTINYPIWFVLAGLVLGLMIEFWLRKTVSQSTMKRR